MLITKKKFNQAIRELNHAIEYKGGSVVRDGWPVSLETRLDSITSDIKELRAEFNLILTHLNVVIQEVPPQPAKLVIKKAK